MHQFLCSSDTEDIVEHAVDEVEDAYSPHESEEGTLVHEIMFVSLSTLFMC